MAKRKKRRQSKAHVEAEARLGVEIQEKREAEAEVERLKWDAEHCCQDKGGGRDSGRITAVPHPDGSTVKAAAKPAVLKDGYQHGNETADASERDRDV